MDTNHCGSQKMRGAHRTTRRRARDERGAVAVEFALVVPVLILLVLGILEFGLAYHGWDSTQNAAREGARLGAVSPDPLEIEARVRGATDFLDQDNLTVSVDCGATGGPFVTCSSDPGAWADGQIVRVTVVYSYDFLTPLPNFVGLGSDMSMRSVSEARFEGV